MTNLEHNLKEYTKFIEETRPEPELNPALNPEWVIEMLKHLNTEQIINPEWIRARYTVIWLGIQEMKEPPAMWLVDNLHGKT